MLVLINCWIFDHVCSFINKTSRWFKYVCNKTWTCKISARFHSLTEMSPGQNGPGQNGPDQNGPRPKRPRPKRLRLNQPDRIGQTETARPKVAYPKLNIVQTINEVHTASFETSISRGIFNDMQNPLLKKSRSDIFTPSSSNMSMWICLELHENLSSATSNL